MGRFIAFLYGLASYVVFAGAFRGGKRICDGSSSRCTSEPLACGRGISSPASL